MTIDGMTCAHCQKQVHDALSVIPGVTAVTVDLKSKSARIESNQAIRTSVFAQAITDAGYTLIIPKEEKQMETTLKIEGMMCNHCKKHVEEALSAMDGVTSVKVDLETKSADVKAIREISIDEFTKVIADAGYELVNIHN